MYNMQHIYTSFAIWLFWILEESKGGIMKKIQIKEIKK